MKIVRSLLLCPLLLACAPVLFSAEGEAAKDEPVIKTAAGELELKTFTIDSEAWAEGVPPKEVFVVDGTIRIATKDGSKMIKVEESPIVDANAQLGESSLADETITAKVLASKKGRSYPRFGLGVHGNSGYRLMVNCAKKTMELIKDDVVVKDAPFTWTTDAWTMVKLEARQREPGKWLVSAKVWPAADKEPADAQITHADDKMKGQGKASIWGTPFSEMPIFFDDIKITAYTKKK